MKQPRYVEKICAASFRRRVNLRVWTLLFCSIILFHEPSSMVGVKTATANTHLGIRGQQAPDLNLTDWIDGDGKRIDPIHLSNYRGKVVYLYFFQDW